MANTAAVYARIDPQLKEEVETILDQLHVSPSALIQMLYGQIKLTRSIPFEIKLPARKPVFLDELTPEELNAELAKGYQAVQEGRTYSADEVDAILKKNLGL